MNHRSVSSTISSTPNEISCSVPDLELDWSCLTLCSVSSELSFSWVVSSLISDARNLVESSLAGTVSTRVKIIEFILSFSFNIPKSFSRKYRSRSYVQMDHSTRKLDYSPLISLRICRAEQEAKSDVRSFWPADWFEQVRKKVNIQVKSLSQLWK